MEDIRVYQLKQALIAVFSTAASMGIDIDVLVEEAARHLVEEEHMGWFDMCPPGAVMELLYCRDLVEGDVHDA
jgi:hypothetical protein